MSDPIGLVSGAGGASPLRPVKGPASVDRAGGGNGDANFRDMLLQNLREVNDARLEADRAVEDALTGQRDDLEGVILATQKADNAFKMLQRCAAR